MQHWYARQAEMAQKRVPCMTAHIVLSRLNEAMHLQICSYHILIM